MIELDLNYSSFQQDWFALEKEEAYRLFGSLQKIRQLTWQQVYRDRGLKWEAVHSRRGPGGQKLYSLRVSQKMRAVVYRDENFMTFVSLHPDHDSAYKK